MCEQSRSVVANHVGFWGLQRWFESSRDYSSDVRILTAIGTQRYVLQSKRNSVTYYYAGV